MNPTDTDYYFRIPRVLVGRRIAAARAAIDAMPAAEAAYIASDYTARGEFEAAIAARDNALAALGHMIVHMADEYGNGGAE